MAAWILVPCLVQLRAEFNRIAPDRDKSSDGSIGDDAHQDSVSDHNPDETGSVPIRDVDSTNEVHAIDVDKDLRESDLTMEKVVQFLLGRCRSGVENRLRYIIFNGRIWSASSGWVQKTYAGSNSHSQHAHFSASYTASREASTASWHLEDIPVALTQADKDWYTAQLDSKLNAAIGELKGFIEARVGDCVPMWDAAGNTVDNKVWVSTALNQIGRIASRTEGKVNDLLAETAPPSTDDN